MRLQVQVSLGVVLLAFVLGASPVKAGLAEASDMARCGGRTACDGAGVRVALDEKTKKLIEELDKLQAKVDQLISRPIVGTPPPAILAPTPQAQRASGKERAIQRFDEQEKLNVEKSLRELVRP